MELTEEKRYELVARFEDLFSGITRPGAEKLLTSIRNSDFYTAPASTRFHGNFTGGLLLHSLNVYDRLKEKVESGLFGEANQDTVLIVGLLHDICKTFFYVQGFKNQKTYDEAKVAAASKYQIKHDSNGDFIWETVPSYEVDDKFPYGHGEKSVMMIEQHMILEPIERYAIRWHMGFTEPKDHWGTLRDAIAKYPLILATMEADMEATFIMEKEEGL